MTPCEQCKRIVALLDRPGFPTEEELLDAIHALAQEREAKQKELPLKGEQ